MKVQRKSQLTGNMGEMEIPLTQEELDAGLARSWSANPGVGTEHMQDIFPQLNADEREFLMTGITVEEWDSMVKGPEDE
jgi:hypothetical protein